MSSTLYSYTNQDQPIYPIAGELLSGNAAAGTVLTADGHGGSRWQEGASGGLQYIQVPPETPPTTPNPDGDLKLVLIASDYSESYTKQTGYLYLIYNNTNN